MKVLIILLTVTLNASLLFGQISLNKSEIDSIYKQYLDRIELPRKESLKRLPEIETKFKTNQLHPSDLYLVVILRDSIGLWEQVYMKVNHWEKDSINAILSTEMNIVKGYPYGSVFLFTQDNIIDWLIIHPDGREEGNYIIKYLTGLKE